MFSKILVLFVLATVCVINASVFTINAYNDCNPQECDQWCRSFKLPGGACVHGFCKCDIILNPEEDFWEEKPLDLKEDLASATKTPQLLAAVGSIRSDSAGGHDGLNPQHLKDLLSSGTGDAEFPTELLSAGNCNLRLCYEQCRRHGFHGGSCVNGRCKCKNFLNTEDTSTMIGPVVIPSEPLSCNSIACDDQCRRSGWHSGVCIKGQCKCDYFLNTKELDPRRICELKKCNLNCTRRDYASARCNNGWCKCYHKIEDASPLNDVTSDESDELNYDEPIIPSPSACNAITCTQRCYRLKFPGGQCRLGQCICYLH